MIRVSLHCQAKVAGCVCDEPMAFVVVGSDRLSRWCGRCHHGQAVERRLPPKVVPCRRPLVLRSRAQRRDACVWCPQPTPRV